MSKYRGLFTFDADNHKYVTLQQADGIIDLLDTDDYVPTEPLIKDEEVRAMVRIWAEHHNSSGKLLYLKLDGQDGHYLLDRKALRSIDVDIENLKIHEVYTITELCGEEEKR